MSELKKWLVDVPVPFNIWIRPECQKRQWEVIRQARPRILFVVSDGGRTDEEWALINQNRTMVDTGIDWDCEVHKLYSDKNYGMYTRMIPVSAVFQASIISAIMIGRLRTISSPSTITSGDLRPGRGCTRITTTSITERTRISLIF